MPDGEVSIIRQGEHQVFTIGRNPWERDTFSLFGGSVHTLRRTEFTGFRIESYPAQVITDTVQRHLLFISVSPAEIQCFPVRCPVGECFHIPLPAYQGVSEECFLFGIINHQVGSQVGYLYGFLSR